MIKTASSNYFSSLLGQVVTVSKIEDGKEYLIGIFCGPDRVLNSALFVQEHERDKIAKQKQETKASRIADHPGGTVVKIIEPPHIDYSHDQVIGGRE